MTATVIVEIVAFSISPSLFIFASVRKKELK